jgi:UDP-N-acetylglucosamine transferase subunit ALG13
LIFVTVGAQMPFDRMIEIVDAWAGATGRRDVFAQIGPSTLRPRHLEFAAFVEPEAFQRRVREADAIVAHAGMGTILTAVQARKPTLVFPRREALRETRNDHQVETARRMAEAGWVTAALEPDDLRAALDRIDALPVPAVRIGPFAEPRLIEAVRAVVRAGPG